MNAVSWSLFWLTECSIPCNTLWNTSRNIYLKKENAHLPLAKGSSVGLTPTSSGYTDFVFSMFPKAVSLQYQRSAKAWRVLLSCSCTKLVKALREPVTAGIIGEVSRIEYCVQVVLNATMNRHKYIMYLRKW